MVPYVRKSFRKHFKDGMIYVEGYRANEDLDKEMEKYNDIGIYDNKYQNYSKAFNYAMDMTEKEIHQAVEALYHNLK